MRSVVALSVLTLIFAVVVIVSESRRGKAAGVGGASRPDSGLSGVAHDLVRRPVVLSLRSKRGHYA